MGLVVTATAMGVALSQAGTARLWCIASEQTRACTGVASSQRYRTVVDTVKEERE